MTRAEAWRQARARLGLPDPPLRRMIRERAGLTQAEMAAILAVDRTAVNRWEMGSRRPSARVVGPYVALLDHLREAVA